MVRVTEDGGLLITINNLLHLLSISSLQNIQSFCLIVLCNVIDATDLFAFVGMAAVSKKEKLLGTF